MAASLHMEFRTKISWDDAISRIRNKELVQIKTGQAATRAEHRKSSGASYLVGNLPPALA